MTFLEFLKTSWLSYAISLIIIVAISLIILCFNNDIAKSFVSGALVATPIIMCFEWYKVR